MNRVHSTAIVEDGARLGDDVAIGPFCRVGGKVALEDGVVLESHVVVGGRTRIGARTRVASFAAIGGAPQDLGFSGEDTALDIGTDCWIREYVTMHCGTAKGRVTTRVGAHCLLMIGSHVAHDCILGDHVILSNQATLGGHVTLGDHCILGGLAAVQQRTHLGAHAYVGGMTGVTRDVVPFVAVTGRRDRLAGINVRGLKRRGFERETIHALRAAYRAFFFEEGARAEKIERVAERFGDVPAVGEFVAFLRAAGNRPLSWPRRLDDQEEQEDE
jgi:UDP-N-acetylglucosamine acyltransferase